MPRRRRRWHHRPWAQAALAWLAAAAYIRLVQRSGRWELRYDPATAQLIRGRRPFIGAFWHGRMLMIAAAWPMLLAELGVRSAPCSPMSSAPTTRTAA